MFFLNFLDNKMSFFGIQGGFLGKAPFLLLETFLVQLPIIIIYWLGWL